MNHEHDLEDQIELRRLQLTCDELAGRATPPDRLDAILRRAAGTNITAPRRRSRAHVLAAAVVLLGVSATVGVALLRRDGGATTRDEFADRGSFARSILAAPQDPPSPVRSAERGTERGTQEPVKVEPAPKPVDPVPVRPPQDPPAKDTKQPQQRDAKGQDAKEQAKTDVGKQGDKPKGTDPADLAAMRSAEAMLEAERKLAEQIKAGMITGLDKILPFDELTSWPYEKGLAGMPERVRNLSGKRVLMTGFMLPIDEVQDIKEFLLVQSLWSCCYGQPPDIHGIVRVVMPKGKTTDYFFDPLKIIGTFKVEETVMDGYCVDIYQLHVESVEVIR